jgi:hypothetical protein
MFRDPTCGPTSLIGHLSNQNDKPKRVPKSDKVQFERFVATARKLGANESMEDFEVKFKKIVPQKRRVKASSTKDVDSAI